MINFSFFSIKEGYVNLRPSSATFFNLFDTSYLKDSRVKYIIKEVDKGEVEGRSIYIPEIDEVISPYDLSGGAKNLILPVIMEKEYPEQKYFISSSNLGNNCVNTLCELSKNMTIGLSLVTPLRIQDIHYKTYDFYNIDYDKPIKSFNEYAKIFRKFSDENPDELGAV